MLPSRRRVLTDAASLAFAVGARRDDGTGLTHVIQFGPGRKPLKPSKALSRNGAASRASWPGRLSAPTTAVAGAPRGPGAPGVEKPRRAVIGKAKQVIKPKRPKMPAWRITIAKLKISTRSLARQRLRAGPASAWSRSHGSLAGAEAALAALGT